MNDIDLQGELTAHFRSAAAEIELVTDPATEVAQRVARRRRHRQRRYAMTATAMIALVLVVVGAAVMQSRPDGLHVTAGGAPIANGQPVFVASRLPPGLVGTRPFVLAAPMYVVINDGDGVRVVAAIGDVSSFLRDAHAKHARRTTIKGLRGATYEVADSVVGIGKVPSGEHAFAFVVTVGETGLAYVQAARDATAFDAAVTHQSGSAAGDWSRLLTQGAPQPATTIYSGAAANAAVPLSVTLIALPSSCASVPPLAGGPTRTLTVGRELVPVYQATFATIGPNRDAHLAPGVQFCLARAGASVTVQFIGPTLTDSLLTEIAVGIRPATSAERAAMKRDRTRGATLPPSWAAVVQ